MSNLNNKPTSMINIFLFKRYVKKITGIYTDGRSYLYTKRRDITTYMDIVTTIKDKNLATINKI